MSTDTIWASIYKQRLHDIIHAGNVKPSYKLSTSRRVCNVIASIVCCSTIGLPCMVWDCLCCCATASCIPRRNPCPWGSALQCIHVMYETTFTDQHTMTLRDMLSTGIEISPSTFCEVCQEYINAFDCQVGLKTIKGARNANIIRSELFIMFQLFSPAYQHRMLVDTGDIDKLRKCLKEIQS